MSEYANKIFENPKWLIKNVIFFHFITDDFFSSVGFKGDCNDQNQKVSTVGDRIFCSSWVITPGEFM